jgi:hypothetical protein
MRVLTILFVALLVGCSGQPWKAQSPVGLAASCQSEAGMGIEATVKKSRRSYRESTHTDCGEHEQSSYSYRQSKRRSTRKLEYERDTARGSVEIKERLDHGRRSSYEYERTEINKTGPVPGSFRFRFNWKLD